MKQKSRNLSEWYQIVTECRQSGLSDAAWCEANGISAKSFYNAVSRLRKKACEIPNSALRTRQIDFTNQKQDIVKVNIAPETSPVETVPVMETAPVYLENSHTVEININGLSIKLSNSVDPVLLDHLLCSLRGPLC